MTIAVLAFQIKFLNELERIERKRHDEAEREALFRAAKSRTKTEDPEKERMRAKAKEMQRFEDEQAQQKQANNTAMLAIGGQPRKKLRLDGGGDSDGPSGPSGGLGGPGGPSGPSGLDTNSILFPFCKKSLICLEGNSMTSQRGNTIIFCSSQQLPCLCLGPSKGF